MVNNHKGTVYKTRKGVGYVDDPMFKLDHKEFVEIGNDIQVFGARWYVCLKNPVVIDFVKRSKYSKYITGSTVVNKLEVIYGTIDGEPYLFLKKELYKK